MKSHESETGHDESDLVPLRAVFGQSQCGQKRWRIATGLAIAAGFLAILIYSIAQPSRTSPIAAGAFTATVAFLNEPLRSSLGSIPEHILQRFSRAVTLRPNWTTLLMGTVALEVYGLFALPYGLKSRFLKLTVAIGHPLHATLNAVKLFCVPSLLEEIVFRVCLLPYPDAGIAAIAWLLWIAVSVGAFVLYHWLMGKLLRQYARATLCDRRFLLLAGGLGAVLAVVYSLTGSLWPITLIHWIVVLAWIYGLGGRDRLFNH